VKRARHAACQRGDREHPQQREEPVDEVVRVKARGVEGEARPRPADRNEEGEKPPEAGSRGVGAQSERDLGDGADEDEIEEELEPRRVALALGFERPQARRLEQTRERVQGAVEASWGTRRC
jgi:hypothetical protein